MVIQMARFGRMISMPPERTNTLISFDPKGVFA